MADSSTGGFVRPTSVAPINDQALYAALQETVVGITGLPGTLVWPRWQPNPPNRPAITSDWAAIGTTTIDSDDAPAIIHDGSGDGTDEMQIHEFIDVQASFYGPNAESNTKLLRDGLKLPQNREAMGVYGLKLIKISGHTRSADLVNNQWYPRCDITIKVRREIDRTYSILNLLSADVLVATDNGIAVELQPSATRGLDFSKPLDSGYLALF